MSRFGKVLAIIFGVILLLPGLCFLGFGVVFTFGNGTTALGIGELLVAAVFLFIAVALFNAGS